MVEKSSRLSIALLGPPVVTVGRDPLVVDTKKAVALLAYLAVEESRPSRDQLVDLLWSESDVERGRSALRRTLSALRTGLGGGRLQADRDRVWLERAGLTVDLEEVDRLLHQDHGHAVDLVCPDCVKPLQRAARLHRGTFLSGFQIKAARGWEEWVRQVEGERRRVRQLVYDRLTRAYAAIEDYRAAARTAEERIAADPLDEAGYRHLMLALAHAGDRNGALLAYRKCVQVLETELGVAPLEETDDLNQAILASDLPRFPGVRRRPAAEAVPSPRRDLLGRRSELAEVETLLGEASSEGRVLLINGPEGIGKTRVLDELIHLARQGQRVVVTGRGYESEKEMPYGVVAQIVDAALSTVNFPPREVPSWVLAEVSRLAPSLGAAPALELEPGPAERRLVEGLSRFLMALPAGGVVAVDAVEAADPASLQVLAYLARQFHQTRGLLVLSGRYQDLAATSALRALASSAPSHVRHLALGPLDAAATAALAQSRGLPRLSPEELIRRTGGIPLYVVGEIDASGEEAARASVRRRLDQLSQLGMQTVSALALAERPVNMEWLEPVSGRSEEELVTGLEENIRAGLVQELDDGTVDLSHDLARRLVKERTTLARRRLLHRRAAQALGSDPAHAALAVRHLREAGREAEAAQAAVRAGQHALSLFALREAKDHFETALALGPAQLPLVQRALGDIALLQGRFGEARHHFEAAASESSGADLALVEHRLGDVARRVGDFAAAQLQFQRAERRHPQPARLLADRALLARRLGHLEEARRLAERARQRAVDEADLARALGLIGMLTEEAEEAIALLEQSLQRAGEDPTLRAAAHNSLSYAHQRAGHLDEALLAAQRGLDLVRSVGDRHREAALLNRLADVLHLQGRVEESKEALRQAVGIFSDLHTVEAPVPELWLLTEW